MKPKIILLSYESGEGYGVRGDTAAMAILTRFEEFEEYLIFKYGKVECRRVQKELKEIREYVVNLPYEKQGKIVKAFRD